MPSFKTLIRSGVKVSPGSTITVGTLAIDVGGTKEEVTVKGEAPLIQAATGEKSFSIDPEQAAALPLGNRSYIALLLLAPGVNVDPSALASQLTPMSGMLAQVTSANRLSPRRAHRTLAASARSSSTAATGP